MMQDSQVSATTLQMRDEEDHISMKSARHPRYSCAGPLSIGAFQEVKTRSFAAEGYRAGSIRANAFISSTIHGGSAIGEGDGTTTASLSNQPFKRSQTSMKRCSWRSESTRRNDPRIGG